MNADPRPEVAFYCVSSGPYFLGAVGMINSLRLLGHDEPIYLLDCGLDARQRELISAEATVIAAPPGTPPWLLKTIAPLSHPAEVRVLIDVDMVAVRRLDELIARAAGGMVLAFENEMDRWVDEWGEVLDLGALRRQTYACSGLIVAGGAIGAEALRLMDDRQRRIDFERSHFAANDQSYPLLFIDQDVFNAVIASRLTPEQVSVGALRMAPMPPFAGLRLLDPVTLRCAYEDGVEPWVVHHFTEKPWLTHTYDGVYSRALRRLLSWPDVAIQVPERDLPLRLREGRLASLERLVVNAGQRVRWHVREPIQAWLRESSGRRGGA